MIETDKLAELRAKATPGPWGMETVRTSCGVCHKIGPWPHKWRHGSNMSACIYDDYPSPPEGTDTMLANAALIALAPDLAAEVLSLRAQLAATQAQAKEDALQYLSDAGQDAEKYAALHGVAKGLVDAAKQTWDQACANHDKEPPVKYLAPYGGIVSLKNALTAWEAHNAEG
jgi:hypothetical protein